MPNLVTQMRDEGKREKAMGDGAALGHFLRGALRIDVNPLVVAGDFSESVDARLIDLDPFTRLKLFADRSLHLDN
jgi:hypothetical protein